MCTADITYFIAESAVVDGSGYTRQLPATAIYGGVRYYCYCFRRPSISEKRVCDNNRSNITHTHTHRVTFECVMCVQCALFEIDVIVRPPAEGAETIRDDKIMYASWRSPGIWTYL